MNAPRKPEPLKRIMDRVLNSLHVKVHTAIQWMKTVHRTNAGMRQVCHTRNGPYWYDNAIVVEPQGLTSGITAGMVGLVVKPGAMCEEVVLINPSIARERPTYVDNKAVCLYTPYQSRVFMTEQGDIELGTKLADYKDTAALLDEGAKVRLLADGKLEVYSEVEVRLRAQPKGGEGTSAIVVLRPDGVLEVTTSGDVVVGAQGSVSVTSQQSISVQGVAGVVLENDAGARVRLSGADVLVEPGGGGHVQLGGEQGKALAEAERTAALLSRVEEALNLHSHAQHGVPPSPVALPLNQSAFPFFELTTAPSIAVTKVVGV